MAEIVFPTGLDSDPVSFTPSLYREATQIRANAVVLGRPAPVVPGTEALRLEGTVTRQLQNNLIQVNTELGTFTVRYAGSTQALPASGQAVPGVGARLALTLSPSGTSVRTEPAGAAQPQHTQSHSLQGQAALSRDAMRPALALAQTTASRITQSSMGPAFSMQNAAPPRPPDETPPAGNRPLSQLEGSAIGAKRGGELWFRGNFIAGREGGLQEGLRNPAALRAFADASQLAHADPAQQIVQHFRTATQPYHTMMEALMLLNPAISGSLTARVPRANSSFGIGLMFFFLCLRHGGVRRWLGEEAEREIRLGEMDDMFDYLDEQIMPRMREVPGHGAWAVSIAPFLLDDISQFVWAVQNTVSGHRSRLPVHRFALQLPFAKLGPVQFSGHLIGQTIDILCLTPRPLPRALEREINESAPRILAHYRFAGEIEFSYDAGLWIPFIENLSFDSRF